MDALNSKIISFHNYFLFMNILSKRIFFYQFNNVSTLVQFAYDLKIKSLHNLCNKYYKYDSFNKSI